MRNLVRPIVVLGAARSGTKMLRAAIAAHSQISAVPWDINFIWKYDKYELPHDELRPENLSPATRNAIRRALARFVRGKTNRLVEKTVSNTLRVPFVRAVLPDCQMIHLIRDGRDGAESACRMWREPMDMRAALSKLRAFPLRAIPAYATRYARSYLYRRRSPVQRVGTWGPIWIGLDQDLARHSLIEICAIQWRKCVESTLDALAEMPPTQWLEVRYEKLVAEPEGEMARVMSFLDLDMRMEVGNYARASITSSNVGKWKQRLPDQHAEEMAVILEPTLRRLDYLK